MAKMNSLAKRAGRLPLDPIVGAMLGGAVAFLCVAMPADLLEAGVSATGLPGILAAAEPPLGLKARALIAIIAGLGAFALTWWGLSRFDQPKRRRPRIADEDADEAVEFFVSAPRRRNFSAASEPLRPIFADAELGARLDDAELPLDLVPGQILPTEPETIEGEVIVPPAPRAEATPPEIEPETFDAAPLPPAPPPFELPPPRSGETIGSLMSRLESGLVKRARAVPEAPRIADTASSTAPAPASPAGSKDELDSALQNALRELHRMAGGRG